MTDTNHYETLEVRDFASSEVVKGAYKHLSQRWHPDKNPDDLARASTMTMALNAAYFVLSDPARRASFDNELRARRERPSSSRPPPSPGHGGSSAYERPAPPPPPPSQQQHRPYAEQVRAAERPPGRVRFYLCLYALGFIAYGMFHFDLAGAGWGAALAVVTIVGMVVAASRPTNEGGLRVLIATGIVCALLAFYGQMHPADPVAEPDVGKPESPVIAEETPPVETSPVSSESVDEVAVAAQNEPSAPSEEVASLPTDAKTSTDAAGPNSDEVSNVTGAVDADVPPAQEAVTRPAQVTFAALRYPPQAVRLRHEGTVTLEVSVDASGSVASMRVAQSSGWPELDREAERSRTTVVISAYRDGRPVDSVVRIPVTFSLNK